MSSASELYEVGAVPLGYVGIVASWRRPSVKNAHLGSMLIIQTCGGVDEGAYEPPASITIQSHAGLVSLRAAIDEALKQPSAPE